AGFRTRAESKFDLPGVASELVGAVRARGTGPQPDAPRGRRLATAGRVGQQARLACRRRLDRAALAGGRGGGGGGEGGDGGEEEMERARQVGAHCVKAALPVEGSIEAAQRQRHASTGEHRLRTSARPAEAAAVTPPPRAAPGPGPMAPRPRERLSVEGSMPCSAWGED
ncbi:unnamed protein product, partial [Prorocentrum cordatum]